MRTSLRLTGALLMLCLGTTVQAQRTRTERECKPYEQRGALGMRGSGPLPTSDGRVLKICRTCTYEVRRFFLDKKVGCQPWPPLPNG